MAQLYRVVLRWQQKQHHRRAEYRYIVREGRLSGPFPSARCPVYCFREEICCSRPYALASRARMNRKTKQEKRMNGSINFSIDATD